MNDIASPITDKAPNKGYEPIIQTFISVCVFLTFALSLVVKSGYSYGTVFILLAALIYIPFIRKKSFDFYTLLLGSTFLFMSLSLALDAYRSDVSSSGYNYALRFFAATFILLFLRKYPPKIQFFWSGIAVGGIAAGCYALTEVIFFNIERASGFQNAIQFGNIALTLACCSAAGYMCLSRDLIGKTGKVLLYWSFVFGCIASLCSLSRGGWIAVLLALPVTLLIFNAYQNFDKKSLYKLIAGGLLAITVAGIATNGAVIDRIGLAFLEFGNYKKYQDEDSSTGARLALWSFAIDQAMSAPIIGVSRKELIENKQVLVSKGEVDPIVLPLGHMHNEFLDAFAVRGMVGLTVLLLIFFIPLRYFHRKIKNLKKQNYRESDFSNLLALSLSGFMVPVLFMGYGLTQVSFAHNSGIMIYVMLIIILYVLVSSFQKDEQKTI